MFYVSAKMKLRVSDKFLDKMVVKKGARCMSIKYTSKMFT